MTPIFTTCEGVKCGESSNLFISQRGKSSVRFRARCRHIASRQYQAHHLQLYAASPISRNIAVMVSYRFSVLALLALRTIGAVAANAVSKSRLESIHVLGASVALYDIH